MSAVRGVNEAMPGTPVTADPATPAILELVRNGVASTRPEIARAAGLGRNVVASRVDDLIACGLLVEGRGRSTGGRAARELSISPDAGMVLSAHLGATTMRVAVCNLLGEVLGEAQQESDVSAGPDVTLEQVASLFDVLRTRHDLPLRGVGVSVPGPVEFSTGRPVNPPIMPGWDNYDVRGYFTTRYSVPAWVDNDVNVMALGEYRDPAGIARRHRDVIYVKVGTGIGAGLISNGVLHRGANGCAGDIGHMVAGNQSIVCRCGKRDCLEALAGARALARDGERAAREGRSPFLARLVDSGRTITGADVGEGARHGDVACVDLITASARRVGEVLSGLVSFFNPSLVLLGGAVSASGDMYLATVHREILARSLPLATRTLRVAQSPLGSTAGLRGTAALVIDELLSPRHLDAWLTRTAAV